jgi:hypothetical protein
MHLHQDNIKILYHEDVNADKEYIYTNESLLSLDGKKSRFHCETIFKIKNGVLHTVV